MKSALLVCFRIYQSWLSSVLPFNHCRFVPSCSEYAIEAVNRYGAARGLLLSARRLLSCHPFHKHDVYDPIP